MVPSRNFTVRYAAVEATPVAAATADAPDEVTSELNVTQSPLNSRRLSNLVSFFTIRSRPLPPIELGRAGAQPGSLTRPRVRLLTPGGGPRYCLITLLLFIGGTAAERKPNCDYRKEWPHDIPVEVIIGLAKTPSSVSSMVSST
jgi:hypothetical protein